MTNVNTKFIIFSVISLISYVWENFIFYRKYRKFTINFKFVPYLCFFIFLLIKLLYSIQFSIGDSGFNLTVLKGLTYQGFAYVNRVSLTLLVAIGLINAIDWSWSSKIKTMLIVKRWLYTMLAIHFAFILLNLIWLSSIFEISIKYIFITLVTMITWIGLYKVYTNQSLKMLFKIILMYLIVIPSKFFQSLISFNFDWNTTIRLTQQRFHYDFNLVPKFVELENTEFATFEFVTFLFLLRWALSLVAVYIAHRNQAKDSTKIFIFFNAHIIVLFAYMIVIFLFF